MLSGHTLQSISQSLLSVILISKREPFTALYKVAVASQELPSASSPVKLSLVFQIGLQSKTRLHKPQSDSPYIKFG